MDGQEQAALVVTQVSVDGLERQAQAGIRVYLVGVEHRASVVGQEHRVYQVGQERQASQVTQESVVGVELQA